MNKIVEFFNPWKWFDFTPVEVMKEKKYKFLNTKEIINIYGEPKENPRYLKTIILPYPMRLSWDKKTIVKVMRCHSLLADDFENIFKEVLEFYGIKEIQRLGIDLFGGCFSFRKMRGGSDWSRHSWGIAIDLDPERNGLRTVYSKAQFSKPEYEKLHEIFKKYGFLNLGKEKNYDTMHFEKAIEI